MEHESTRSRRYTPILAMPYWEAIGDFIDASVTDLSHTTRDSKGLYSALTPYVLWCWQTRGFALQRDRIYRRSLADQFIHLATPQLSDPSKATLRSALWRAIETLNPDDTSVSGTTLPRSKPTLPYSRADIAKLLSWANSQSTTRRAEDASVLLALGLGAGLATREILDVRVADITAKRDQVYVSVWASRPRLVPVMTPWQRALLERADSEPQSGWAFRPGRRSSTSGQVTDFMSRAQSDLDIRPARMRATWLHAHMSQGTSAVELLQISGLRNLAALQNSLHITPRMRGKRK